ncbi:hypothetical protein Tco_1259042, partial [Tanacetum coccineum]
KDDGIFTSQDKYVAEFLKKFNYTDVKSASTPVDLEKPLVKDGDADDVDVNLYRSMIGDSPFELVAYTDSDYVGATQDKKSITRGCQFLGNRLISWQCKKQNVVATSTTKAEYMAAANLLTKGFDAGRMERAATTASSLEAEYDSVTQDETQQDDNVPTPFNDPPLSEKAKDAQAKEIADLKKRVQKLERKKKSRTTRLKRLRKVGMSRRVESFEDKDSLGDHEDASKQGRSIKYIDKDADINVDMPVGEKQEQSAKEREVHTSVEDSVAPTTIEEITLAQTLIQIKAAKPKVVTTAATTTTTTRPKARVPEVPLKRKDQVAFDEDLARNLQAQLEAKLIEEERIARKKEEEANIALIEHKIIHKL